MLNAAFVNGLQAVELCVMRKGAIDVSEIEPLYVAGCESLQIGGVYHMRVNLGCERIGNGLRGCLGQLADEPSVIRGRRIHDLSAAFSKRVKVEYNLNIFCRRMFLGKSDRAQEPNLFAICK